MDRLPVECICCILAFTSPKDVCKIAGVSTAFRSAADSDLLWRTFLPPDYRQIIAQSSSSPLFWFLNSLPEKALYFHLSDHPLLIGTGNSSITLEKDSGSKCYMIGSRDIDATMRQPYWTWKFVLQSRFFEAADVHSTITTLRMKGKIEAKNLSPKTYYVVYFVFKFKHGIQEYSHTSCPFKPIRSYLCLQGEEKKVRVVDAFEGFPMERKDGWMEIEMGQFFNHGDDASIIFSVFPTCVSCMLVFEGIEFRPIS